MTDYQYYCPCGHHVKCDSIEDAKNAYAEHEACEFHHISEIVDMDDYKQCDSCKYKVAVIFTPTKNVCYTCHNNEIIRSSD